MPIRSLTVVLLALSLSGCFPLWQSSLVYMPDAPLRHGGGCPAVYIARVFEQDGVALNFLAEHTAATELRGELRLRVPRERFATLAETRLTLAGPALSEPMTIALPTDCGSTSRCMVRAPLISQQEVTVTFPAVVIDGVHHAVSPIRFTPEVRPEVCWLSA